MIYTVCGIRSVSVSEGGRGHLSSDDVPAESQVISAICEAIGKEAHYCERLLKFGAALPSCRINAGRDPYRLWHGLVYSSDSQHVHQSDVIQFLDVDISTGVFSPRWFTSLEEVRATLHKAAFLYLQSMIEMSRRMWFEESVSERIRQYSSDLREWSIGTE